MAQYLHSSNTPSWCDAQLKHRDNFTSYHCIPMQLIKRRFYQETN